MRLQVGGAELGMRLHPQLLYGTVNTGDVLVLCRTVAKYCSLKLMLFSELKCYKVTFRRCNKAIISKVLLNQKLYLEAFAALALLFLFLLASAIASIYRKEHYNIMCIIEISHITVKCKRIIFNIYH